jgi:uncharacterized protein
MKCRWSAFLLLLTGLLFSVSTLWASEFVVPPLRGPVQDEIGFFSTAAQSEVSTFLRQIVERGGPQIQVLVLPDLQNYDIQEAAIKIVEQWKLGRAGKDDGVLFLIAQKERKLRLEVGRGLEGDLPDVVAKRIISRMISPLLKVGRRDEALYQSVRSILQYTAPDLLASTQSLSNAQDLEVNGKSEDSSFFWLLLLLFVVYGIARLGGGPFSGLSGRRYGGYYGGRGGFGSGGGWSGGGGGFGGGGASGRW